MRRQPSSWLILVGGALFWGGLWLGGQVSAPRVVSVDQARADRMVGALSEWTKLDIQKEEINRLAVARRGLIEAQQLKLKAAIERDVSCAVDEAHVPQQVREFMYTPTPQPTWNPQDYDPSRMGR